MARKRAKNEDVPTPRVRGGPSPAKLLQDLRDLIRSARSGVAQAVNSALVLLYWQVGQRIRTEILESKRAAYGAEIVSTLSRQLSAGIRQRLLTSESLPHDPIRGVFRGRRDCLDAVETIELEPFRRDPSTEGPAPAGFLCGDVPDRAVERPDAAGRKSAGCSSSGRRCRRKPEMLVKQELAKLREEDTLTPDLVFRDPYFLDFLGLKDAYSEKDLEAAILREMEQFILELGAGFTFVARQKRIVIDGEDFYLDLLFYHRKLRRLVAVELKLERFKAADKGQMELYLRWLEKHEMEPGEETPIGLILCADKGDEQVELLQLDKSGIRVASYLTDLPPRQLLRRKLHETLLAARADWKARERAIPVRIAERW